MSDYSPSSTLQSTPTASTVEVHPDTITRKQLSYEDSENEVGYRLIIIDISL